ncbi:MAG: serine/threonine protein phosphatase [Lachnospiraceae bacterium]|nr:serine/threonine protein phosphatase [Lachnospiraceae bacterium]
MATYAISDIHGEYDKFIELLNIINLKEEDTLYVLGDILDRGPYPIKVLKKLMGMPNVICIVGNHEIMALECLEFLSKEITDTSLEELDKEMLENLVTWQYNGSSTTIKEFKELDKESRIDVIEYIKDFLVYDKLTIEGRKFLLVHAGLGNFSPDKDIEDYSLHDLVWKRADYNVQYFDDVYVISGHTPTQTIEGNPNPGFIYKNNNHIAIDCGAHYPGGRLAAICLDTMEEFYVGTGC